MPNYDLFYVWSGEGTVILNKKRYDVGKGHCFLFRPGDETEATHNPQNPLVLTYIHFDIAKTAKLIPSPHRIIENTISFESLLTQYVRLFLVKTYGAEIEGKLILKQLMIHLLREEQEKQEGDDDTSNNLLETIGKLLIIFSNILESPIRLKVYRHEQTFLSDTFPKSLNKLLAIRLSPILFIPA